MQKIRKITNCKIARFGIRKKEREGKRNRSKVRVSESVALREPVAIKSMVF
jgi:hypothetical protein